MKVCWYGIYDRDYSRNQVLISGLEEAGVDIVECNTIGLKGIKKYFKLIKHLRSLKYDYDVLFCAFPINYNVLIAKIFSRKPIVIDAFFPLYDAYIKDRKTSSKYSIKALVYYFLDRINLYLADLIITDTEQHRDYWLQFKPSARVEVIRVGANTKEFFPIKDNREIQTNRTLVTFHGSYIPLQGIDKIVDSAEILRDNANIKFRFIGDGQMYQSIEKRINQKGLDIELIPWLSPRELNKKLNESDIVLGIFGDTEKTNRVIPNKVFQGIAVKKPVISKDTKAMREIFSDKDVFLVQNTPTVIANAINELHKNPEKGHQLAKEAYKKFRAELTEREIGLGLEKILHQICK